MRKIILYIATSLNGKIARKDGSMDWLEIAYTKCDIAIKISRWKSKRIEVVL